MVRGAWRLGARLEPNTGKFWVRNGRSERTTIPPAPHRWNCRVGARAARERAFWGDHIIPRRPQSGHAPWSSKD